MNTEIELMLDEQYRVTLEEVAQVRLVVRKRNGS